MNEVAAETSISPSSRLSGFTVSEALRARTYTCGKQSARASTVESHSLECEPWLWHLLNGLENVFNPCLNFFHLEDGIFTE